MIREQKTTIVISSSRSEEMESNPLFFLRLYSNVHYDNIGNEIDNSTWQSIDRDLDIIFKADNFADRNLKYCLCVIDSVLPKKDNKGNNIDGTSEMTFHAASATSIKDWQSIFHNYFSRAQNAEDKYSFMSLLWMLDKKSWSIQTLESCLQLYNKPQVMPFLISTLGKICRCLSIRKQTDIKELCRRLGGKYEIYSPPIITQLHQYLFHKKIDDTNLFSLVDEIFNVPFNGVKMSMLISSNPLATVLKWFYTNDKLSNYSILCNVFSLLNENKRLDIVKRYFHDIRLQHNKIDINLIRQFKDNDFDEFIRYRYCIESPTEPIVLTVPLLCDTLIALYNSEGRSFQTFEGVLDFAMTHCDTAHPAIDFKLDRFIPSCNQGAVYNAQSFKGFIDYALIRKLNESLMSEEHLRSTFIYLMDKHAVRQKYPVCKYGNGTMIPDNEFKHCSQVRNSKSKENAKSNELAWHLECFHYIPYKDRWTIKNDEFRFLKDFLKDPITTPVEHEYNISLDMLSPEKLRAYIYDLPKKFDVLDNDEFLTSSKEKVSDFDSYLLKEYSDIIRMRIFPQKDAIVGQKFDVFGFWKEIACNLPEETLRDSQSEQYKNAYDRFIKMESQEVRKRCIESLKKELNSQFINDSYFELAYDRILLSKTLKRFYHKESFNEDDKIYQHEFLTQSYKKKSYVQYCAPQLSKTNNPAIDLPYFWCRGKECFKNNLGTQTLEDEPDWYNYSLFHMAEIMDYPMLHKTEAGYEPEPHVWQFIAIANKVIKKFKHLKCRSCGHMLFTGKSSGFNRYNYYVCVNPTCSQLSKEIYLNFCFNCKKGLIDSRDTKQCPNGWYICPTCLSCCNDAQYERLAQRYLLSALPVPNYIESKRGHGHNDKGQHFCPFCGNPIEITIDEKDNTHRHCKNCGRNFDFD